MLQFGNKLKSKKGQAAITDALFFLLIIVTLSVLLFRYSSTYGTRIEKASNDLYFKDYTNSVLRTIFYTSVPLDFNLDIRQARETDYLMTQIKQDFYADGKIGSTDINTLGTTYNDIAKYNLFHTVKATMYPLKSHDYVFYLYDQTQNNDTFFYFMIKLTNFQCTSISGPTKTMSCSVNPDEPETYYLCDPEGGYSQVRSIISKSPTIFSSSVPLSFIKYTSLASEQREFLTIATFAIWPATTDINPDDLDLLNCEEVTN